MKDRPILLYLHGVGQGEPQQQWRESLSRALDQIGYPELDQVDILAPSYADALRTAPEETTLPPLTVREDASPMDFGGRTSAMEHRLGRHRRGAGGAVPTAMVSYSVDLRPFQQARNYLDDPRVRGQVLKRILSIIPDSGRMVILGHSLGSVIAADLLRRLPPEVEVTGLVTIGSPLGNSSFDVGGLKSQLKNPPGNLAWWVNFWSDTDPVVARRGISADFPWVLDYGVPTALLPGTAHSSRLYVSDPVVAEAIGFGLFGSRSGELVLAEKGAAIAPDELETYQLQALRLCHLIRGRLKGDQRLRYDRALRAVQADVVGWIIERNHREQRPVPAAIMHLDFDYADVEAPAPEPRPAPYMDRVEAIPRLLTLVGENLLSPYEIEVEQKVILAALQEFTVETHLGSQLGTDIIEALDEATTVVTGGRRSNWLKWGAVGLSATFLLIGTGGLALAAAPGVAGAAAVTSALAAFGPGGMIGGLATAGTLLTTGGAGMATGLLNPGTTAEEAEGVVVRNLAVALVRRRQGLEADERIWLQFVDSERALHRELARTEAISDADAPNRKALKHKVRALGRALDHLRKLGLDADILEDTPEPGPAGLPRGRLPRKIGRT